MQRSLIYHSGYIPKTQAGQELFRSPGRSQEDIKNLLVKETLTFDELNIAIEEAGKEIVTRYFKSQHIKIYITKTKVQCKALIIVN